MPSRIIKTVAVVALTAAVAVTGTLVLAQGAGALGRPGHRSWSGRAGGLAMLRQLGLSDQQRQQVHAILDQHKAGFQAARQRLGTAREVQRAAIQTTPVDENQIRATTTELASAEGDLAVLRARVRSEVFQILTPDQQAKAQQMQAEREKMRTEWRQRMQQLRQSSPPKP